MDYERPTPGELELLGFIPNFESLCHQTYWDTELRVIGALLITATENGRGWTQAALRDVTGYSRGTVRRRVWLLEVGGLAEVDSEGVIRSTPLGTDIHIRTLREFDAIARGEQAGLSADLIRDIREIEAGMDAKGVLPSRRPRVDWDYLSRASFARLTLPRPLK